jgi:hypothetical protein
MFLSSLLSPPSISPTLTYLRDIFFIFPFLSLTGPHSDFFKNILFFSPAGNRDLQATPRVAEEKTITLILRLKVPSGQIGSA